MENTHSQDSARQHDPYTRAPRRGEGESQSFEPNPWKENHGNLLLGFAAILCLIGTCVIACRQTRFLPPSFPSRLTRDAGTLDGQGPSAAGGADSKKVVRTVDLRILGAASDMGTMKIAMYISPDGFNDPKKAFEVDSWRIVNGVCTGQWEVAAELNQVAIAAYHDANDNNELDRNALGIPSERYGFSGGARGFTGPPTFQEAVIMIDDKPIDISIR